MRERDSGACMCVCVCCGGGWRRERTPGSAKGRIQRRVVRRRQKIVWRASTEPPYDSGKKEVKRAWGAPLGYGASGPHAAHLVGLPGREDTRSTGGVRLHCALIRHR